MILALLTTLGFCAALFVHGLREQVRESDAQKRARMIDDLVWDNTTWINHADGGHEAPKAGIARLHKELGRGR